MSQTKHKMQFGQRAVKKMKIVDIAQVLLIDKRLN